MPVLSFETTDTDIIFRMHKPVSFRYDIVTIHDIQSKYTMNKPVVYPMGENEGITLRCSSDGNDDLTELMRIYVN